MAYDVWETCMFVDIGLKTGACASWVQAWGSMIAILMSGVIAWWQIRAARLGTLRSQRERAFALVESTAEVARSFSMELASIAAAFDQAPQHEPFKKRHWDLEPFRNIQLSALAIPLHDLPDPETVKLMIGFRNLVVTSRSAVARLAKLLDDPVEVAFTANPVALGHLVAAAQANDQRWRDVVLRLARDR
ncbi:hypothetical protein LJR084_001189 [Variovorax sp. LjRoot84]|uniref:hypothetical protein n=1 Tax=Variovorax sp. LjRoot84 TaxID=3342340 RepID=UPI003ECE43C6